MSPTISMATIDTAHNNDSNGNILYHDTSPAPLPSVQISSIYLVYTPTACYEAHTQYKLAQGPILQTFFPSKFKFNRLQNFAHAMAGQLSCQVQNRIVITPLHLGWQHNEFPSNLNSDGEMLQEMGPIISSVQSQCNMVFPNTHKRSLPCESKFLEAVQYRISIPKLILNSNLVKSCLSITSV